MIDWTLILTALGIIVAIIIGVWQIYLAQKQNKLRVAKKDFQAPETNLQKRQSTIDKDILSEHKIVKEEARHEINIRGYVENLTQIGTVKGNVLISTSSTILQEIWDKLEPNLQDTLSLAYNQARRDEKNTITTDYFLAAFIRLKPNPLQDFLNRLPQNALPKPISVQVTTEEFLLSENAKLAKDIEETLRYFADKASPQQRLSITNVFFDIIKYGSGESISCLRENGVTPGKIDEIIKQLGWAIVEREFNSVPHLRYDERRLCPQCKQSKLEERDKVGGGISSFPVTTLYYCEKCGYYEVGNTYWTSDY
jgi:hypothetical protein